MQKDNLTHADVMSEYFSDEALKDEFTFTDFDVAESIDEIKSYLAARVTELIDEYGEDDLISRDFLEERYEYRDRIDYGAGEEIHQFLDQSHIDILIKSTRYCLRRAYEDAGRNHAIYVDILRDEYNLYADLFKSYMTAEQWQQYNDTYDDDVGEKLVDAVCGAINWSDYARWYVENHVSFILDVDYPYDITRDEQFWDYVEWDIVETAIKNIAETMLDWLKEEDDVEAKSE